MLKLLSNKGLRLFGFKNPTIIAHIILEIEPKIHCKFKFFISTSKSPHFELHSPSTTFQVFVAITAQVFPPPSSY
ncbi:hypothetical protein EGI31_09360 [Lacihabitans soyangensis]|uniref:Uncharacterized protein n=1 Tax=Lacihabitans soyangensis TaxID=869394 RepID=A0AAE3KSI9_9BACT|nr:hypothetical protein [Lacihabitans soyangensis]